MSYRPDQRQVKSRIMTPAGWLQGTLHVPRASKLVPYLNAQPDFLRMTDVSFLGRPNRIGFMSVQRRGMSILVPDAEEQDLAIVDESTLPQRVFVLLEAGVLAGSIRLRQGVRLSDFFSKQHGFILLHDCSLQVGEAGQPRVEERHPAVLVNSQCVVAVSEAE